MVSQVNSPYLLLVREGHNTSKHTIYVTPPEGPNVNRALVEQGWCWWDRKYGPEDTVLEQLEAEARDGRKGLLADPHPVPP